MGNNFFSININNIYENNNVCVLELIGYLDAYTSSSLERVIENCINSKFYNIIIDFSKLNYISSAGLGVFMVFVESVRENNGDIIMSNMNEKTANIFNLVGFHEIFIVTKNISEAIRLFNNI